jgi:hypothetical protein
MVMGPEHRKESRAAKVTANAVECERRLVERREVSLALLEKLPSLTEIVVVTERGLRATTRQGSLLAGLGSFRAQLLGADTCSGDVESADR